MSAVTVLKVWDRNEGESELAYERFVAYRDMKPRRSLELLAQRLGVDRSAVGQQSSRWEWQARCRAFDRQWEADAKAELSAVRLGAATDVMSTAGQVSRIAMQALNAAIVGLAPYADPNNPLALDADQAVKAMNSAVAAMKAVTDIVTNPELVKFLGLNKAETEDIRELGLGIGLEDPKDLLVAFLQVTTGVFDVRERIGLDDDVIDVDDPDLEGPPERDLFAPVIDTEAVDDPPQIERLDPWDDDPS